MQNSLVVLDPRQQHNDPRIELEPETLALAKRNAFPLVAQRSSKKCTSLGTPGARATSGWAPMSPSHHVVPERAVPTPT